MHGAELSQIPDISRLASHLADPGRARMLCQLMAGQALTASELALGAGLTPQAASNHLARLLDAHIVSVIKQGRHRYYALAADTVAQALETLTAAALALDERSPRFRPRTPPSLRQGRTCYRHLAGRLGVSLLEAMVAAGHWRWREGALAVTGQGWRWLEVTLVIDASDLRSSGASSLRPCLDWSERRYHAAGPCATAMMAAMTAKDWLVCGPGRRASLTPAGRAALTRELPALRLDG